MQLIDFSNGFDTLLSSYAYAAGFGEEASKGTLALDEYEKSVLLTKSQEETVIGLYTGRNSSLQGFEETEELRRYLSNLVSETRLSPIASISGKPLGLDSLSKFFTLPADLWFILYESVEVSDGKCGNTVMDVVPVTLDEYHRVKRNPFRGANDRRALRLDLSEGQVEVISKYSVTSYYVRYLKALQPIVLIDLADGQAINGVTTKTPCRLHEALHQRILEGAVRLALQSRGYSTGNNRENN